MGSRCRRPAEAPESFSEVGSTAVGGEGPLCGGKRARGSRGPGTLLYPRAPRMRDIIDHHSRSAAGVSLSTSTRSDTTKSRYWVTTIRSPVVETTPPTPAPSGRVVRCNRWCPTPWVARSAGRRPRTGSFALAVLDDDFFRRSLVPTCKEIGADESRV